MIQLYINSKLISYKSFIFPGGEVQVKLPEIVPTGYFRIFALLKNSADIMELLILKDALDRSGKYCDTFLDLAYLPYARQDRVCDGGEALGVSVMAALINSMRFDRVHIHDPHSDVGPALINNCKIISQETAPQLFNKVSYDYVIAPDAGAAKKALRVAQRLGCDLIQANKIRDVKTGDIVSTQIDASKLIGKKVIVVDDICDGGMSFIKLAEKCIVPINESEDGYPSRIDLFVTHGIFSKGKEVLGMYDNIYCKFDWSEV